MLDVAPAAIVNQRAERIEQRGEMRMAEVEHHAVREIARPQVVRARGARPSAAAPAEVAIAKASLGCHWSETDPICMRATASAQRIASVMSCVRLSVPSAMRAPACFSFGVGAIAPPVALPFGTCATVMPDAAMPRDVVVGEIDAVRGDQLVGQQADSLEQLRRRAAAALGDDRIFQLALREMCPDRSARSRVRAPATLPSSSSEQVSGACGASITWVRPSFAPWCRLHQRAASRRCTPRRLRARAARRPHARA